MQALRLVHRYQILTREGYVHILPGSTILVADEDAEKITSQIPDNWENVTEEVSRAAEDLPVSTPGTSEEGGPVETVGSASRPTSRRGR